MPRFVPSFPSQPGSLLTRLQQTALDFVLSHPQLEKTQIFLYGQSIGGAVAIDLASRNLARVRPSPLLLPPILTRSHRSTASSSKTPSSPSPNSFRTSSLS